MGFDVPLLPGKSQATPAWVADEGLLASRPGNIVLAKAPGEIDTRPQPYGFEARPDANRSTSDRLNLRFLQEKVDSDQIGSWEQAKDLYELGSFELANGSNSNAEGDLGRAVQIMRSRPQSRPDQATADKDLMLALGEYGTALTASKESDVGLDKVSLGARILADRKAADAAYSEALTYADKYSAPVERSDLLRRKAVNDVALASMNDVKTDSGKAAYREGMLKAETDLNDAARSVQGDNSNSALAAQALTIGDLAYVEMHRADSVNDTDAQNTERHYRQAIALWHKYDPTAPAPGKDFVASSEVQAATNSRDTALLADLSGLRTLLMAEQRGDEALGLDPEIRRILAARKLTTPQ